MRHTFVVAALTVGLLALAPMAVTAQKKTKDKDTVETATDQDYKSLQGVKEMTGKWMGSSLDTANFRMDTPYLVPNPKYKAPTGSANPNNQLNTLYRQQAQVMNTTNPVKRQLRMQELMATMQKIDYQQMVASSNPDNQPYMFAHHYKDFELDLSDKLIVRKMVLEKVYDDKGNLKSYTSAEKEKLREPTSLPGYKAKIEDLDQTGLHVKITLKMPKKKATPPAKKASDTAAADKGAADKGAADDKAAAKPKVDSADQVNDSVKKNAKAKDVVVKPIITMVVILDSLDVQASAGPQPAKKAKNDN